MNKQQILIIDDEPEILALLSVLLEAQGYEVSTAESGLMALGLLESKNFDAVVCDYMMPQMDGITILKEVRVKKNYVPFVFFSGNAQEKHGLKMKNLGAYEIVAKPDVERLTDVIVETINHNEKVKVLNPLNDEADEFTDLVYSTAS